MSNLPIFEARTSITGKVDTEVLAVFQESGKKAVFPKGAYGGLVEKLRKPEVFSAQWGEFQFIRFGGKELAENVMLVGLGSIEELVLGNRAKTEPELSQAASSQSASSLSAIEEKFRLAGGHVWAKLNSEKSSIISILVDSFFEPKDILAYLAPACCMRAFAEGMILSAYRFDKYKTKVEDLEEANTTPVKVVFLTQEKGLKSQLELELIQVQSIGEAVTLTRDWSNEPSNYGTPEYFANEAKKLARQYGLRSEILTEQDVIREKMGLFLGVGQGANRKGRFVIVEYSPKNFKKTKGLKTIALVGKGVTFDSGGISIKPALKMEDMKHDMTGAATVMGAVLLASQWEVQNRVIGLMAFTENMPDGNAIQPGNILTARNGKTVEIINTDAEGRLVLADALDYAQDYKPDAIIDVATLTGAVSIALGKQCCAVLGNDDQLIHALCRAGEIHGERIWQLPLYDEYFEDLKSDYADLKNSANDSNGGTIRGAMFLKQFIKKKVRWAHLDIAGMAYHVNHLPYYPKKGASGAYVRTLAQFVADY